MSEDQIRQELAEQRTLIREMHAELVNMIDQIKTSTVAIVTARNEDLKKDLKEQTKELLRSFRWFIGILVIIVMAFFSWLAIDHLTLKSNVKELDHDYSSTILLAPKDHFESIMYENIVKKRNPTRGDDNITPLKEKSISTIK